MKIYIMNSNNCAPAEFGRGAILFAEINERLVCDEYVAGSKGLFAAFSDAADRLQAGAGVNFRL